MFWKVPCGNQHILSLAVLQVGPNASSTLQIKTQSSSSQGFGSSCGPTPDQRMTTLVASLIVAEYLTKTT